MNQISSGNTKRTLGPCDHSLTSDHPKRRAFTIATIRHVALHLTSSESYLELCAFDLVLEHTNMRLGHRVSKLFEQTRHADYLCDSEPPKPPE